MKPSTSVSVVMPVFNEASFIESALKSLQAQNSDGFELEILVIDGMSEDGTQDKVRTLASRDPRIKLLSNPSRHTPAALNIGLRAAAGEYVCIMGAHAAYDPDYVSVCLEELRAHQAVGCSGKVVTAPANKSMQARLVAWASGHPFASSTRSVRTQPEGYADTVAFPVMRKQPLLDTGGYNEKLVRNQDNDMNQRLRAQGCKLYVTGKTQCRYHARPDVGSFLRYAFLNGLWNAFSLRENRESMGLRHLAPLAFVAVLVILLALQVGAVLAGIGTVLPLLALAGILAVHLSVGTLAGLQTSWRQRTPAALSLAPLILGFHCAYGLGTMRGLLFPFAIQPSATVRAIPESSDDPA
ncbi:MAG TPA: glycosyltransferase family 2 protein [Candidatus Angelobacter sp.]|nr:glycosyltransferase family 2 protein [Candidatus Angelobacter sp.]